MATAVLFDFDGTLAPNLDLPDMRRQVINITRSYQVPEAVYANRYIVEVIDAAGDWLRRQQGDAVAQRYSRQSHQKIIDIEMSAAAHTRPFSDVPLMLQHLAALGLKLAVVTRNCRAAVLQTFPDLLTHIDLLVARDDTPHLKPDPRHLSGCLQYLGCQPRSSVMVGDGHLDMQAGAALDMYCVGVLTGSSNHDALQAAGAHHILPLLTPTNLSQHLDCVDFQ